MKHLLIIGARGWGREVYHTFIHTQSYLSGEIDVKGFLDDNPDALDGLKGDWPKIIGSVEDYSVQEDDVFFCAMGDSHWRKHYADIIEKRGGHFISIIHRLALVSHVAEIGDGSFIGAYTSVSPNVHLGKHTMVHGFCTLGHDVVVCDYASIESYVFMGGYSRLGDCSTMHTKSNIIPHKKVGRDAVVGFGSVVMRNVKDGQHVFGNPAQKVDI